MTSMADHLFGMALALPLLWPLLIGAVVADLTNKRKVVR